MTSMLDEGEGERSVPVNNIANRSDFYNNTDHRPASPASPANVRWEVHEESNDQNNNANNIYNDHQNDNNNRADSDDDDNDLNDDEDFDVISKKHYLSTVAMCVCTFTHSWLLVSVFPYSGFMVISLVNGTDTENAGPYAGLLAATFMIGRAVTSFFWGRIGDTYGRRVVLFLSLGASSVFSVLFGMSTSFGLALLWRFLLGASNGIAGISKAVVSETAKGNDVLETRGMSLSMGMWAWGFLLSPAIAGFVSDPIRQYPSLFAEHIDSPIYKFLRYYPFVIPNLISVGLCCVGIIVVHLLVPETLPSRDRRHPKYMISDLRSWLRTKWQILARIGSTDVNSTVGPDTEPFIRRTSTLSDPSLVSESDDAENEHGIDQHYQRQSLRDARMAHTESVSLLSTSSPFPTMEPPVTASVSPYNHRNDNKGPTSNIFHNQPVENRRRTSMQPPMTNPSPNASPWRSSSVMRTPKATLKSLWRNRDTRNHLLLYWVFSFVAIAIDEAFPLFCISRTGGLGLSENSIGKLLSSTGLLFAATQYHVYAWIVDRYGLTKSIQLGAVLSAPLAAFIPFSLWMNSKASVHQYDHVTNNSTADFSSGVVESEQSSSSGSSDLTLPAFIYLSLLLAACRIFGLVFFSSITIATNRTVIPSHRGTMNGLSMLGGSVAKGLGPVIAGLLFGFGISSGTFEPKVGSFVVFGMIGSSAAIIAAWSMSVLGPYDFAPEIDYDDGSGQLHMSLTRMETPDDGDWLS